MTRPRRPRGRAARPAPAALALALALAAPARAWTLAEGDTATLTLGGYARTLTGLQISPVDDSAAALGLPRHVGLGSGVLRLEWRLSLGDVATLDVHDRLFLDTRSERIEGGAFGVGVTTAPKRTVDLRSVLVETDTLLLEHDLDRLSLRLFLGKVDLALGRQAISWGTSLLFTVADVWAAFSPFDLDTSQKRGLDAFRLVTTLGERTELDVVLADRGRVEDLSAGLRTTFYLSWADLYVAFGKLWRELSLMGGLSAEVGSFKVRGEAHLPYDLDDAALQRPRATVGLDWFRPDLVLTVEAHYNGAGAADPDDYLRHATTSPELARGEVYWLGRYYLGASLQWTPIQTVQLGLTTLGNLRDPSLLVGTTVTYEATQDVLLSLGAYDTVGARPSALPAPTLGSELGAYGHFVYMQLAAFF